MNATARIKAIFVGISLVILGVIVACGEASTPSVVPTATPGSTLSAEDVAAQLQAALAAQEAGLSAEDVQAAIAEALAAAGGEEAVSASELQAAIAAALAASQPDLSAEDVQMAIAEAVAAIPPPQVDPFGTLNVGLVDLGANINVLHNQPLSSFRFDNVVTHEAMFATTPEAQVENRLVEDWSVDSSGLVYTFNLRQGVQWHRGYGEFTADDFIFSIEDVVKEGTPHSASGFMRRVWTCDECELTKIDRYTVQLTRPAPTFEITWHSRSPRDGSQLSLHSKAQFDALGEDRANEESVGTGPWALTSFKKGVSRRVEAVRDHWRKTPEFEEMIWWEIQEVETRVANFLVGRIDTGQFTTDSIQTIKREDPAGLKFLELPGGANLYLNFLGQQYYTDHAAHVPDDEGNVRVPLGDNAYDCSVPYVACDRDLTSEGWEKALKVRLAMSLAIDRQKLINNLAFGDGKLFFIPWWTGQDFRINQFGLDQLSRPFDPVRAKELMAEAGYPDGFEIDLAFSEGFFPGVIPVLEAVGTMWEEVGITTKGFNMPFSAYRPSLVNRTAKAIFPLGANPSLSPLSSYSLFFAPTSGLNVGLEHPELSDLMDVARGLIDDDARWEALANIAKWMFDNVMVLSLYNQATLAPVGPKIDTWPLQAHGSPLLNNYEFVPHRR